MFLYKSKRNSNPSRAQSEQSQDGAGGREWCSSPRLCIRCW